MLLFVLIQALCLGHYSIESTGHMQAYVDVRIQKEWKQHAQCEMVLHKSPQTDSRKFQNDAYELASMRQCIISTRCI